MKINIYIESKNISKSSLVKKRDTLLLLLL